MEVGDYVYIFFWERALESNDWKTVARVARVCKVCLLLLPFFFPFLVFLLPFLVFFLPFLVFFFAFLGVFVVIEVVNTYAWLSIVV